jgi:hypothetical protein
MSRVWDIYYPRADAKTELNYCIMAVQLAGLSVDLSGQQSQDLQWVQHHSQKVNFQIF